MLQKEILKNVASATQTRRVKMESIPTELLIITFEFLNPFTLCQLAKVSKEFRECTANDKIWRKIRGITKRDMKILAENYEKAHLKAIENWNPVNWVYIERIKDAHENYSEWLKTLKL